MASAPYRRFQSGEICVEAGRYEFDGYVNGPWHSLPALHEWEVSLAAGDLFPAAGNPRRACYWKLVAGVLDEELDEARAAPG